MNFVSTAKVKIRKPRKCWGCTRTFPIGAVMERNTYADGRQISSSYWCSDCQEYISKNPDGDWVDEDGMEFGSLLNDQEYEKRLFVDPEEHYVYLAVPCPTCPDISERIRLNGTGGVHVNVPKCLEVLR